MLKIMLLAITSFLAGISGVLLVLMYKAYVFLKDMDKEG